MSFISKIIEKAITTQIHSHLINNDIVDNFQSAYKTGHSCETALLRVYNDIVTTIGRGNGAMLVLLDQVYVDDTQLYVSFKCKQPLEAISKLNSCLADIRRWMITNKLKINDSKTEFIVFRSPQLKCDLSGLSVNVGESMITQSSKVRDLGVIFDQFLNFDDHITAIIM